MNFEMPVWGKYEKNIGAHHLSHHMADVAACFMSLAELPVWRNRLEQAAGMPLDRQQIERLAVLVFLHDIGKLLPGFQAKVWSDDIKQQLACQDRRRCHDAIGHTQAAAELMLVGSPRADIKPILVALKIAEISHWADHSILINLLLASFAHHGRPIGYRTSPQDIAVSWQPLGGYAPLPHAEAIGAVMMDWFPTAFATPEDLVELPESAAFQHLFAGMIALADWIGSDRHFFPFVEKSDESYFAGAQEQAQNALEAIGIDTEAQRVRHRKSSFSLLTGHAMPNPQQEAIGNISTEEQLVILEAETGSGKTEAALWRFLKLYEAGRVDGLYFAVPTRSAAVQLHHRIHKAASRVFGDDAPETVLAVPGYYKAGDHQGHPLPEWKVLWDDDGLASNETIAKRWAAEHSKRYLAAQIAVGTIDQAMLGALPVKHAHLRASALARSLLVIDEVHASDSYMTKIQQKLVEDHMAIGGQVLAMSATLGSVVRSKWLGQVAPSFENAEKTGYPTIWIKKQEDPILPGGDREHQGKIIAMSLLATMAADKVAERALEAARQGAKILIIRNTVDEAVKCFAAVEEQLDNDEQHLLFQVNDVATLHHGRFAAEDRKLLDARVEELYGKKGKRPDHGVILIGTQTLEQSLDICADYMITDLCPVDVLLQRLGRLHRHKSNQRPKGFEQAQCRVLLPEEGLEKCLDGMINGLGAWQNRDRTLSGIYMNVAGLELTRRMIVEHPQWQIPAMNRELVESATHPERIAAVVEELGTAWQSYHLQLDNEIMAEALFADIGAMDRHKDFSELTFPGSEEQIRTRLGEDGFQIELDPPLAGPFGERISRIVLPAHWSRGINHDAEAKANEQEAGILRIETDEDMFDYGRLGIVKVEE